LLHERPCARAATSAKPVGVGSNFESVLVTMAARWFSTVAADPEVGGVLVRRIGEGAPIVHTG
jgi:hypothetical protein